MPSRSEKGQISIMVGVMIMTFILFFAFVINTGMLVNAKINLQNAADMAAYAGASVQARQLNQISYLNYEMRRQWKKFLFRIYVLGNMAQDSFHDSQGGNGQMEYYPNSARKAQDKYDVPATCIIFNETDNFCHLSVLPKIVIPPATFVDSIADTLRDQLTQIEKIRQNNCKGIALTNLMVNLYWLYNTDPYMDKYKSVQLEQEQVNALQMIQGMTTGLGVVPRELLLGYRIRNLAKYVNSPTQTRLTKSKVDGLLNTADPASHERSIQAFYSAYYTLGNHTYPTDGITMDELLPANSTLLLLKEIHQSIDTYSITFDLKGPNADSMDCNAYLSPISVPQPLTVGFYKDPQILTYYAVRLKGKARLLFSPFGDLELKAYAAAQPFGSRIGPRLSENAGFGSTAQANFSSNPSQSSLLNLVGILPNLPIKEDEPDSPSFAKGWNTKEVVTAMYQALRGANPGKIIDSTDMKRAYQVAMLPNPWEANRYNIMNDEGADPFMRNYGSDQKGVFWAPLFPPGQSASEIQDQLTSDLQKLFATNASTTTGSAGVANGSASVAAQKVRDAVLSGITTYFAQLREGKGEDGEGMNLVQLSNPFKMGDGSPVVGTNQTIFMTSPTMFKSSWNSVNDSNFRALGRVGYSVKFVSFDSLSAHKLSADGSGSSSWTNAIDQDPEAQGDIPFIKH